MSLSAQIFFVVFSAIGMGTTLRLALQAASTFLQRRGGKVEKAESLHPSACTVCRSSDRQNVECVGCNPDVYLKGEPK